MPEECSFIVYGTSIVEHINYAKCNFIYRRTEKKCETQTCNLYVLFRKIEIHSETQDNNYGWELIPTKNLKSGGKMSNFNSNYVPPLRTARRKCICLWLHNALLQDLISFMEMLPGNKLWQCSLPLLLLSTFFQT